MSSSHNRSRFCSKTPNDPSCIPTLTPPTPCPDGSQPVINGECPTTIADNATGAGGGGSDGGLFGILGENQTIPDNGNNTGRGLTGNDTLHNITNVTSNTTSSNVSKTLSLSISIAKDPIVRGNKQTITVKVSDENSQQRIGSANVQGNVLYASGSTNNGGKFSGSTDNNGAISHNWPISGNAIPGKFTANVHASKDGYKSAFGTKSFTVKPAGSSPGGGGDGSHNHAARSPAVQQVKYFKEFTDMPSNSPLYITNTSMHKDALNDIIITDEIKNRGTSTANFVELISTFYNINNQTLGNKNTFTKPSTLQPGQAAPFTMYLSPKDMPLDQINRVKYHISWKYAAAVPPPSSSSTTNRILAPPIM